MPGQSSMRMRDTASLEDAGVELTSTLEERERAEPDPDEPFRILVLGDFSGREMRGVREISDLGHTRTPLRVDRDNLDELPGELGTEASVQMVETAPHTAFPIRRLDDFHPDRIFEGHKAFSRLRRTWLGLHDADAYAEAAAEIRSWGSPMGSFSGRKETDEVEKVAPERTEAESLVEELLESPTAQPGDPELDRFISEISAAHTMAADTPEKREFLAQTQKSVESWMQFLLHDREFQALEAAWRSLDFLVRRVDAEAAVEIHILDVSRAELAQDLRSVKNVAASGIHRILVEQAAGTAGASPWSLIVGLWTFAPNVDDVALLGRMSRVAQAAGAPFLAAASSRLAGRTSFGAESADEEDPGAEALWQSLRGFPGAEWIGLALPRFLLRLPYGAETDPTEEIPFEEIPGHADASSLHEDLLWGNPAVVCALLIAQAFEREGWELRPGFVRDVESLPLYVRKPPSGGRAKSTPCAETLLTETDAERLLERGLMPLVSRKDADTVRVPRFQSIRDPLAPLAARWGR